MNLPETCPFCGAGEKGRNSIWMTFNCHTTMHTDAESRRFQAPECKDAERARLAARVAELEARCKRLEELGAELRECAGYLGWTSSDDSDCITRAERACEAWDKEAKG